MKHIRFYFFLPLALAVSLLTSCGETPTTVVADTTPIKDSLAAINDSLRLDPNNLDLYYQRAMYYVKHNDLGSAMMDINRVLAVDSTNTKFLLAGADIHFYSMKIQRADQLLKRAVELEPKNVDCLLRLAQLHFYLKRYDEEVKILDRVIDIDKRNAQAYFMRGMVGKEKGDTAKAMSEMQLAVQMDPDYYNAYIQMGVISAAQRNPMAVEFYRNALEISPTSIEALYNLGMYYQQSGQDRMAINTYSALLTVDPMYFDAHYNIACIYTDKIDSAQKGMENFNLAIRDNPSEPRGYFGRGKCYEKLGDLNAASADYKKALELDPQFTSPALALDRISK
jgi:tetratricopeptide (TPR) repeat protein